MKNITYRFEYPKTCNMCSTSADNAKILGIFSKDILKKIKACETGNWEHAVPNGVAQIIKERSLFGMNCEVK